MPRNDAPAPIHVCPGIRIHAIDIVHPPGIGIPPIEDMDPHQTTVPTALPMKSSAATPRNARSALVVLVMTTPPDARLVAPLRCAIEPWVHAPQTIQPARVGGIGVVHDAVLAHERAHPRPLARVGGRVGSGHGGELGDRTLVVAELPFPLALVVVFDAPVALLLLGEP